MGVSFSSWRLAKYSRIDTHDICYQRKRIRVIVEAHLPVVSRILTETVRICMIYCVPSDRIIL